VGGIRRSLDVLVLHDGGVGSEVVAAAIYCKFWFPGTPPWIWIGLFSLVILYVNTTSIGNLGTFEYWLSMIKVVTIVAFLILGTALLTGIGFPRLGFANFTAHGGFLPNGWTGVGLGVILGLFSSSELKLSEARQVKRRTRK